jgi:EpsI family protein
MFSTVLVLHVRGDVDRVLPSTPLNQLPSALGTRTAIDVPLDQETLDVLGAGYFLNRTYIPAPGSRLAHRGDSQPIGLYIAYFPTQRTGQSIHSPQNCLPGAGWTFLSSGVTELTDATGKHYRVGEYLITDGTSTQEALYWYQLHGRSIASDYMAKLDTVLDSIRLGRSDEALVRITTPLSQGENRSEARRRAIDFAEQITPLLPAYIPN